MLLQSVAGDGVAQWLAKYCDCFGSSLRFISYHRLIQKLKLAKIFLTVHAKTGPTVAKCFRAFQILKMTHLIPNSENDPSFWAGFFKDLGCSLLIHTTVCRNMHKKRMYVLKSKCEFLKYILYLN